MTIADPQSGRELAVSPAEEDASLLARLRGGEGRAYDELAQRCAPMLFATARRMLGNEQDAADAVQEAMLGAFKNIASFDGRSRLSTWITRIVINKCLMKLRSKRRRPETSIEPLLPTFKDDGHPTRWTARWKPEESFERSRLLDLVREKIDDLPNQYREVLLLRDIQQLSTEDTAAALGDTPNAVKVRLHRARQALKALLDPHMDPEWPAGEKKF
jgi:RNA polymerase sigma-70 factor (ECF subfamily)